MRPCLWPALLAGFIDLRENESMGLLLEAVTRAAGMMSKVHAFASFHHTHEGGPQAVSEDYLHAADGVGIAFHGKLGA